MATLDDAVREASESSTVTDSVVAFIGRLASELNAAKSDPVKVGQIVDSLNAQQQKIADAIAANTPAEVPPPGGPVDLPPVDPVA